MTQWNWQLLEQMGPEMADMLRELEWAGAKFDRTRDDDARPCCPSCDADAPSSEWIRETQGFKEKKVGGVHEPDCRLAEVLRELDEADQDRPK